MSKKNNIVLIPAQPGFYLVTPSTGFGQDRSECVELFKESIIAWGFDTDTDMQFPLPITVSGAVEADWSEYAIESPKHDGVCKYFSADSFFETDASLIDFFRQKIEEEAAKRKGQ